MRNYIPEKYIRLVENTDNKLLKTFIEIESVFIREIKSLNEKTIIDLGAGYGRALTILDNRFESYCGIEINDKMYLSLRGKEAYDDKIIAINGDITILRQVLNGYEINFNRTLFLLLQNTLGTIEGDSISLIKELNEIKSLSSCEIVISFFKSSKLPTLGFDMFCDLEELVGVADRKLCDFPNGIFRSNSGYEAKWWSNKEINSIIEKIGLQVAAKIEKEAFCIYHLK